MRRRSLLAGVASFASLLVPKWAKGAFWIGQLSGGFQLPAGVALVPIDGGQTFYASNGFTYAANAGFDTTLFPILDWLVGINPSSAPQPARTIATGCNMIAALDSGGNPALNALTQVQAQPGLYLAQGLISGNSSNTWMVNAGAETVWVFLDDEPRAWNDPTFASTVVDFVSVRAGTNVLSTTPVAGFQTNRPIWANMYHAFFDSPSQLSLTYFPALCPGPLGTGTNCPSGLMTPAEILATPTNNNDSIPRKVDITGSDYYWMTTDMLVLDGSNRGGGVVHGTYDFGASYNPSVGTGGVGPITPGTGSFTFPVDGTLLNQALITGGGGSKATAVSLSNGVDNCAGFATAFTPGSPGSITVNFTVHTGPGTTAGNFAMIMLPSLDQMMRGCNYGDQIDMLRPYLRNPTPLIAVVESAAPGNTARQITPPQMNAASWCSIIHGARGLLYFSVNFNTAGGAPGPGASVCFGRVYYQTIQSGNTISIFDSAKATNYLIQTLTPIIHSQFAEGTPGYVTVAGDNTGGSTAGFRAPYRVGGGIYGPGTYPVLNERGCYPYTGGPGVTGSYPFAANNPAYNFNVSWASAFEVMAKLYQGNPQTVNGVAMAKNQFWIFADYRGSAEDGPNGANANTITATFTIKNTGSTHVTRFYSDAVLGAAAATGFAGTRTTIQCGDNQQIGIGDTVIIAGTTGVPGLNATFVVQSSNYVRTGTAPATFDILLAFSGTFTFLVGPDVGGTATCGAGTIIAQHDITVTGGGTTFTDSFPRGDCIGIYRVN